jgi:hypothetical protein
VKQLACWYFAVLLLVLCTRSFAADQSTTPGFSLSFHAVGTPEFMGPPKIGEPGFIPPIAKRIQVPQGASCLNRERTGEFEAYVNTEGIVETVISHNEPVEGTSCQKKYLFPALLQWKFRPATYQGKPTPVYLWIGLNL